jgi:hypothetical protein
MCNTFGNVNGTGDSIHGPKDGLHAFFSINFLFHSSRKLVSRRCPGLVMRTVWQEPSHVSSDDLVETRLSCVVACRSKEPRIGDSFPLAVRGKGVWDPGKMEFWEGQVVVEHP